MSNSSKDIFTAQHFANVQDFENYALKTLPRPAADYYRSGACDEHTLKNNKDAFARLRIRPRMLVDVTNTDTSVTILGQKIAIPIGISPTAMQKMAHPKGEIASAEAAAALNTIFTLSTLANTSIENIAEAVPNSIKWFQLYIYKDRRLTESVVRRAERAGFKALVLTVDANVFGIRYNDARNNFQLPPYLRLANFEGGISGMAENDQKGESGLYNYVVSNFDSSVSWKDIRWLKSITKLPLVLKGILTAEDAKIAADLKVAAILVSNHGGRQLDTSPATIEALPEIVESVGHLLEVYLDGGVRFGTDVFKALALGAKMVFVGRPIIWGLAHSGEAGAKKVLQILASEFKDSMGLAGCKRVGDISRNMIVHESYYHKL